MSDEPSRRASRIIRPSVVAVVGASETKPNMGRRLVEAAGRGATPVEVIPIHPRAESIAGFPCRPTLTDACADASPDVVFVATPEPAVPGLLAEAVRAGVPGVVVLTTIAGDDFDEMVRAALGGEEYDPDRHPWFIGPGSNGLVSGALGVSLTSNPSVSDVPRAPDGVAIVTQSGALGLSTVWAHALRADVPVSSVWTLGSQRAIRWWDVAGAALESGEPAAVCVVAEEVCSYEVLADLGRRSREAGIPLGLLHVGRSPGGRTVTLSHTGALGTSARLLRSACFRTGVEPLGELRQLVEFALQAAARDRSRDAETPSPRGGRLRAAVVSPSGGALAYAMDRLDRIELDLPRTPEDVRRDLLELLDTSASVENPYDLGARAATDGAVAAEAIERVLDGSELDALVVCYAADIGLLEVVRRVAAAAERNGVAVDVACLTGNPEVLAEARVLASGSPAVTVWSDLELLVDALAVRAERGEAIPVGGPTVPLDPARVTRIVDALGASTGPVRSELESEVVLTGSAVPRPAGVVLPPGSGPDDPDARAWFADHGGPYVAKGLADGVAHKQRAGLVALGLADAGAVREAVDRFAAAARSHGSDLQGVLLQEMVPYEGAELMVSIRIDGSLGPHCLVARGGTGVEEHGEFTVLFPPFTVDAVRAALSRLAAAGAVLGGDAVRHAEAIADLAATSAAVIAETGRDLTVELNPVVVDARTGALVALDALVTEG